MGVGHLMAFDELLRHQVTLQQGTIVRSDTGEQVIAYATVQDHIPALVRPARVFPALRLGAEEKVTHVIYTRPIAIIQDAEGGTPFRFLNGTDEFIFVDFNDAGAREHHWENRVRRLE